MAKRILARLGLDLWKRKRTVMPPSLTIAAGGRTRVHGGFPQGKDCPSSHWGEFPRAFSAFCFFYFEKMKNKTSKKQHHFVFWGFAEKFREPKIFWDPVV